MNTITENATVNANEMLYVMDQGAVIEASVRAADAYDIYSALQAAGDMTERTILDRDGRPVYCFPEERFSAKERAANAYFNDEDLNKPVVDGFCANFFLEQGLGEKSTVLMGFETAEAAQDYLAAAYDEDTDCDDLYVTDVSNRIWPAYPEA